MKKIIAMLMITAFLLAACTVGNEDSSLIDNDSSSVSVLPNPNEKSSSVLIDGLDYEYQVVYVKRLSGDPNDENGFPTMIAGSVAELRIPVVDNAYDFDMTAGDAPSFNSRMKKYDEAYFEKNNVIYFFVEAEKGVVPSVNSMYKRENGDVALYVDGIEDTQNEKQAYIVFIEIAKSVIGETRYVDLAEYLHDDAAERPADSSEPTEYLTAELIEKSVYEYKVLYTDKLRTDGIFPYGNYADSYKKFDEYNNCSEEEKNSGEEYHTIDELYNIDRAVGKVPSYREWIKKYDKAFFEEYGLIILVVQCEKSIVPKVDSIYKLSDGRIDICVDRCGYTEEEEQVYHIFIEIPKAEMGGRGSNDIDVVDISEKDYIFTRRPLDVGTSE